MKMEIKTRMQALFVLVLGIVFVGVGFGLKSLGVEGAELLTEALVITGAIAIAIQSVWVLIIRDILLVPVKGVKGIKALRVKYLTGKLNRTVKAVVMERIIAQESIRPEVQSNSKVIKLNEKINKHK